MNPFQKLIDFISRPTQSRTMGLVVMLLLVAAVSLTVYVAQQQQSLRQQAADQPVCKDIDNIQKCPASNSCDKEGDNCKIGNTIYECKKQ